MLSNFYVEDHVKSALMEDIGFGDVTTESIVGEDKIFEASLVSRCDGIICGLEVFKTVFKILSDKVEIELLFKDGDKIKKGDVLANLTGPGKYLLLGERVALNYVQRMSGIATETYKYQQAIGDLPCKIVDTRKTTPNFRAFEKYSVKIGGGALHRFNLSDCAMIKDNHIRGVDIIMLDNMTLEQMKEAVQFVNHKAIIEASGNVNLDTVRAIAECGVDIISSSAIVAKAPTLDIALDM